MAPEVDSAKKGQFVEALNAAKRAKADCAMLYVNCTEQYLSDRQVALRFDVSRTKIWRGHDTNPNFPRRIRLSPGTSRWKLSDLVSFEHRVKMRDPTPLATKVGRVSK